MTDPLSTTFGAAFFAVIVYASPTGDHFGTFNYRAPDLKTCAGIVNFKEAQLERLNPTFRICGYCEDLTQYPTQHRPCD